MCMYMCVYIYICILGRPIGARPMRAQGGHRDMAHKGPTGPTRARPTKAQGGPHKGPGEPTRAQPTRAQWVCYQRRVYTKVILAGDLYKCHRRIQGRHRHICIPIYTRSKRTTSAGNRLCNLEGVQSERERLLRDQADLSANCGQSRNGI